MKLSKKTLTILCFVLSIFVVLLILYILHFATEIHVEMEAYETNVAYRNDYTLHTTPLSPKVVEDICLKLDLKGSSEHCRSDAVVFAPDFFDELKIYFETLDEQYKSYNIVQDKLGVYLDYCELPDPDGHYFCHYDLRGDGKYPIHFLFDENDFYYRIIASTGGS